MRIAVLSDTHLESPSPWLEKVFYDHLAPADAVIHCGDITGRKTWEFFEESHPNFHAVAGNMCSYGLCGELPPALDITLGELRVGATHGWGSRNEVSRKVCESFGPGFDLLCHGHTHNYVWTQCPDGTRLLNPGALSGKEPCLAVVTVEPDKSLSVERVFVNS